MRFVSRSSAPSEWSRRAAEATQKAQEHGTEHRFREGVYGDISVRKALMTLFREKCAYCETRFHRPADVDHFRPKGPVEGVTRSRSDGTIEKHPGYYWLAYSWDNLYPACPGCHQKRIDPDHPQLGAQGKGSRFPLLDESTRVWGPEGELQNERRALLDPCQEQPEEHLQMSPLGDLCSAEGSLMGEATISRARGSPSWCLSEERNSRLTNNFASLKRRDGGRSSKTFATAPPQNPDYASLGAQLEEA